MSWADARRPYRGYGYAPLRGWGRGGGGTTLGEWEHNNILCVFIFQIILIFDVFFSFKINFLLVVYLKI